jgi:CheY-like chemotaxis protein
MTIPSFVGLSVRLRIEVGMRSIARQSAPREAGHAMLAVRRILVVDDDEDVRSALDELLTDAGFSVSTACDGQQAIRLLQASARPPDLILLDLQMPRSSGWDVLAAIRSSALLLQTPVVVVSADRSATPLGAVAWLRKPVPVPVLLSTVEKFVRR